MSTRISIGQVRQLSELHRTRSGGILHELIIFAAEHGVADVSAKDPLTLIDPIMGVDADGDGLGQALQVFIARITAGGLKRSNDIRITQTKVLWDAGFGQALGLGPQDFQKYLTGTGVGTDSLERIPDLPVWPAHYLHLLDRDVLVDKRVLAKVGQVEVCRLLGLAYGGNDNTFVSYEPEWE
ncbi:MAG: hypothetical protein O2877_02115, partial [bacterium]|nr:hypothetical protein [bacterium]